MSWDTLQNSKIRGCLEKKLALIPGTKLVITNNFPFIRGEEGSPSETIQVRTVGKHALPAMLELLNKRFETLDLISVMLELERTLSLNLFISSYERSVQIRENLSCVPKLHKKEQLP